MVSSFNKESLNCALLLSEEIRQSAEICERTLEVAGQAVGHVLVEVLDALRHFVRFQLLKGREADILVYFSKT